MSQLLLLLKAILIANISQANQKAADVFDYSTLMQTIKSQNIRKVDDIVSVFPRSMTTNAIYVYDSKALNQDRVSGENPRVILFNSDASLIVSFTQNPGEKTIAEGQDSLEVIHFDKASKTFELVDIVMDGVNPAKANVNPAVCLGCHGQNPRPLFESYNAWPGTFGSFSQLGVAAKGSKEHSYITEFLNNSGKKPRYKDLNTDGFERKNGDYLYSSKNIAPPKFEDYNFTPALIFGGKIEDLMFKKLAWKIFNHKSYEQVAPIIAYTGVENELFDAFCEPPRDRYKTLIDINYVNYQNQVNSLRSAILEQTKKDVADKNADFLKNNIALSDYDPRGVNSLLSLQLVVGHDPYFKLDGESLSYQMVLLETLLQYLGLDATDISSNRSSVTTGMHHARSLDLYKDERFFAGLVENLLKYDPEFSKKYFKIDIVGREFKCDTMVNNAFKGLYSIPLAELNKGILFKSK